MEHAVSQLGSMRRLDRRRLAYDLAGQMKAPYRCLSDVRRGPEVNGRHAAVAAEGRTLRPLLSALLTSILFPPPCRLLLRRSSTWEMLIVSGGERLTSNFYCRVGTQCGFP